MSSPKNKVLHSPKLPKQLQHENIENLEDQGEYACLEISSCDLTGQSAGKLLFEEALLRRTTLTGARLPRPRLLDVRLEACDLSGAFLEEARLRRVELINCRLLGLQMLSAQLDDVLFKDCNLEGAAFAAGNFRAVKFDGCKLSSTSFEGADLEGVRFQGCDLTDADLRNANLVMADLRSSSIDGLQVLPEDLQGAIVSTAQAVQVAGLLGVTVLDDEHEWQ